MRNPDPGAFTNTSWQLESLGDAGNPQPVLAGSEVTMTFSALERVGGRSGCNSYRGKYTTDGARITFSGIASTKMACEPQQLMEQETQFQQALLAVERYELTGDHLELTYGGTKVLRLKALSHNSLNAGSVFTTEAAETAEKRRRSRSEALCVLCVICGREETTGRAVACALVAARLDPARCPLVPRRTARRRYAATPRPRPG